MYVYKQRHGMCIDQAGEVFIRLALSISSRPCRLEEAMHRVNGAAFAAFCAGASDLHPQGMSNSYLIPCDPQLENRCIQAWPITLVRQYLSVVSYSSRDEAL